MSVGLSVSVSVSTVYTVLDGDLLAHFLELSLEEQEAVCEACAGGGVTATEVAQLIDALLHLNTYCNPKPETLNPKP